MSNELEARVARLERAIAYTLGVDLAEHDDPDQAAARAKQDEADAKAGEKAQAAAAKELEGSAA